MKLNFRRLTTRSLDYGGKLIINVTNNNAQEAAKTTPPFLALVNEHANYSKLVPRLGSSKMSDAVKVAAKAVLDSIRNIKRFAAGYEAMYPDSDKGKAATAILKAIAKGGKLYNRPAGDLDSKITTVVTELSSPELAPHVSTMELTEQVQSLVEKKAEYNVIEVQRIDAESALSQTDSASVARPKLESAMRDYLALVTAMRKTEGWQDLYADLNEVVKILKRSIREGKEAEELPPPPDATV